MAVSKITLPNNTTQDVHDARVTGIDSTPTISSGNLVTSGGVYTALGQKGNAKIFYGTCTTSGATADKVVTCSDFTSSELVTGALIFVTFSETNSATKEDLTMNVNSTGAKLLARQLNTYTSGVLVSNGELRSGSTYLFQYNGLAESGDGAWVCMTLDYNTTYTIISTSEMQAGTASTNRNISAARLKESIQYWESISSISVNGAVQTPDANKAVDIACATIGSDYYLHSPDGIKGIMGYTSGYAYALSPDEADGNEDFILATTAYVDNIVGNIETLLSAI